MGWPTHQVNGFVPSSTEWNAIVDALSTAQGAYNGNGQVASGWLQINITPIANAKALQITPAALISAGTQIGGDLVQRANSYDTSNHTRDFYFQPQTSSNAGAGYLGLFTLLDGGSQVNLMWWLSTGYVGIGTTNPVTTNGSTGRILEIATGANTHAGLVLSSQPISGSNIGAFLEARDTGSVSAGDVRLGQLQWARITDITSGQISSVFDLYVNNNGTILDALHITANGHISLGSTGDYGPLGVHVGTNQNLVVFSGGFGLQLAAQNDANNAAVPMCLSSTDFVFTGGPISQTSIAAPSTPPSGQFYIYMDSADNKLKCKGPSGTVTVIGVP